MIICPQCNNQNIDGAAFCDNCGASLTAERPERAVAAAPLPQPAAAAPAAGTVCANCGAAIVPGEAFCGNCGAQISAPAPRPAVPQPVAPQQPVRAAQPIAPTPAAPVAGAAKCPVCGATNLAGQAFCDNCGAALTAAPPAAAPVTPAPPPVIPPPPAMRPRLIVAASGAQIDLAGKTQALIGREDPISGIFPEVDMTSHGGDAGGVSRRHARLSFQGYQWTIEDLNSTNGTWVNNQRLNPNVPQPLKDGDQLRLGKLVLTFQTTYA